MKIAYFNCPSGISGDMMLSSLIDCGLNPKKLEIALKKTLKIKNWKLSFKKIQKGHAQAVHIDVISDYRFHSTSDMRAVISKSALSATVKEKSLQILDVLISAESKIHGTPKNKVHFHEMNSIDTLIDITANVLALNMLGIEKVYSTNINIGRIAPAALEILTAKKVPVYSSTAQFELTTPTGAAIISTLVESFNQPVLKIEKYGFGAGTFDVPGASNLLTVMIGNQSENIAHDKVILLETNIDDLDPRVYPDLSEKLFEAGALDVWLTNITMKKGRPAIKLSILCKEKLETELSNIVFKETTTIGIRRLAYDRHILLRTQNGEHKIATLPDGTTKKSAEYRDAVKKAAANKTPLYKLLKN
ncbi:MAG: nickel pincer cofactor biosynthesis protein LarC [Elusimicrobiota bacterium]